MNKLQRWLRSKTGMRTVAGVLGVLLIVSIAGQALHWWDLGSLLGTAGPPSGGYTCMPTCVESDGKFLSMVGNDMASFSGTPIVFWVQAPSGSASFEIGIFDGDSGKSITGTLSATSWGNGHWDETAEQVVYTLYADKYRDGQGTIIVGQWFGNDPNPANNTATNPFSAWTASADTMPNNAWYNITVNNNVPDALDQGWYYYRLEAVRQATTWGISAFKLRSTGELLAGRAEISNSNFAIVGMANSLEDYKTLYPGFDVANLANLDVNNTTYTGTWEFTFDVPVGTKDITFWDGDFDYGAADGSTVDTTDANTPTSSKPQWATTYANPESAVGKGDPADDASSKYIRRLPSVQYEVISPDGTPLFVNNNPSGSQEWEKFVVARYDQIMDPPADLYTSSGEPIKPGLYTLKITGLDIHNTVWFRMDYTMCKEGECGSICPKCPECEPTPTPEPTVPVPPTDVPPPPTPEPTPLPTPVPCVTTTSPVDLLYVLDTSGSMNFMYLGSGTKLEAAQQAILTLNQAIAAENNGSRVALITFQGSGNGTGHPPIFSNNINVVSGFTADMNAFNALVQALNANGSTPTAAAVNQVTSWLPTAWDPARIPVVILISDGVPTLNLAGHGFQDGDVQQVHIYKSDGSLKTADQVRQLGKRYSQYNNERAGETLADAMIAISNLKTALPSVKLYAVAVQAASTEGIFNDEILRYAAAQGGGQFYMAEDANSLAAALQLAFVNSSCGGGSTPPPPPPGGQVCNSPRDYNVENTTNNPFYGIKFNYVSGGELKNGAEETFKITLTSAQVDSMSQVKMEAKAGTRTGQVTLRGSDGCNFAQGTACGPKQDSNFAFSFVGTNDNGDGTKTLTFTVKNNTNRALSHATIGLPSGAQASWFCPQ